MSDTFQLRVRDVMAKPITIAKSAFVSEALDKMLDEGVDPLIVTNNGTVMARHPVRLSPRRSGAEKPRL